MFRKVPWPNRDDEDIFKLPVDIQLKLHAMWEVEAR